MRIGVILLLGKRMNRVMAFCLLLVGLVSLGTQAFAEPAREAGLQVIRRQQLEANSNFAFPEIVGIADPLRREIVNSSLKRSILALRGSHPNASLNGDFEVTFFNEKLLGIRFWGYTMTPGAAHPSKIDRGIHYDLVSGKIYALSDIFKPEVDYRAKIIEICKQEERDLRLEPAGLWSGWTHTDFANSWRGEDQAFVLQLRSLRVYSIPRYATGSIGGYQLGYESLKEILNTEGALWQALQANVVDKTKIQPGDRIAGLKVDSVNKHKESLIDITFAGEIELTGWVEWAENTGDGPGYLFTVSVADRYRLPALKHGGENRIIRLQLAEGFLPELPKTKTAMQLVLDRISMGERQIEIQAKLVRAKYWTGKSSPPLML